MNDITEMFNNLVSNYSLNIRLSENNSFIYCEKDNIKKLMEILKENYKIMMLSSITAVDYTDRMEVVYHLTMDSADIIKIKAVLDKDGLMLPSINSVWKAAGVQEREVYDLMGIIFEGHDDLKRVLCRDDFEGHPLRKDFALKPVKRF